MSKIDVSDGNPFRQAEGNPFEYAASPVESTGGWRFLALLIAIGIAGAALCSFFGGNPPNMTSIPVVAVTIWLCSLAGFWMAFGSHPIRFLTIPIPFLNAFYLDWLAGGSEFVALTIFFVGIVVVVAVTGAGLRVLFGQLRRDVGANARDALQFDLRHLFILMTTVAGLFGIGRVLQQLEFWSLSGDVAFIVGVLVIAISTMALVSIWGCLGQQLSVPRLTVVCVSIVFAALLTGLAVNGGSGAEFWVPTVLIEQALMLGSLLCVRVERYRFVQVKKA